MGNLSIRDTVLALLADVERAVVERDKDPRAERARVLPVGGGTPARRRRDRASRSTHRRVTSRPAGHQARRGIPSSLRHTGLSPDQPANGPPT